VIEHVIEEVLARLPPDRLGWLVAGGEFFHDRQFTEIASNMVAAIGNELVDRDCWSNAIESVSRN
jgi:hypothetical protein